MKRIKKSNICKNIEEYKINRSIIMDYKPKAGDVAIFEIEAIGSLSALQDEYGRNCYFFEGDKVMLAFGNRYASNQFEGYVPTEYHRQYDLIGKGGVVGIVKSMSLKLENVGPTKLKLIGYATDELNQVINTIYHKNRVQKFKKRTTIKYKTVLSIGSSMDSGKTTSAAFLCRGLKRAGKTVSYIKLTGTVFNKDRLLAYDCGADFTTDFSEFGFPSTYLCTLDTILDLYEGLRAKAAKIKPDYVVIEVADGLLQRETQMLISSTTFMSTINHVLFSCGDSLSAMQGVDTLKAKGIMPFALSGMINTHPLLVDEVNCNLSLPLLGLEQLSSPEIETKLIPAFNGPNTKPEYPEKAVVLDVA